MKKFIFAASLIGVVFASCKKNDDNGGNNSTAIVGKWNWDKSVTSIMVRGEINGSPVDTTTIDTMAINDGSYIEFSSDGKVYSFTSGSTPNRDTGYYSVNGSNLYFTDLAGSDTTTTQIITLSNHALTLYSVMKNSVMGLSTEQKDWSYFSK